MVGVLSGLASGSPQTLRGRMVYSAGWKVSNSPHRGVWRPFRLLWRGESLIEPDSASRSNESNFYSKGSLVCMLTAWYYGLSTRSEAIPSADAYGPGR